MRAGTNNTCASNATGTRAYLYVQITQMKCYHVPLFKKYKIKTKFRKLHCEN